MMTRRHVPISSPTARMTDDQKHTLSMLSPITALSPNLIIPRTNIPEQIYTEIAPAEPVKLFVSGQRGMGKTTELRRFVDMLEGSEFTPIFLQFGSQEQIGHPALIRLMADGLRAELEAVVDDRSFAKLNEWFSSEESSRITEKGVDGTAGIGGSYFVASAKGTIKHSRPTTVKQTTKTESSIRDLVNRFNEVVEKAEKKGGTRLVFVVDDIDKVQDVESVNATFIHSSQFIPCHRLSRLRMYLHRSHYLCDIEFRAPSRATIQWHSQSTSRRSFWSAGSTQQQSAAVHARCF